MLVENMDFCLHSFYPSYTIRLEVVWADREHIPSWKPQNDMFFAWVMIYAALMLSSCSLQIMSGQLIEDTNNWLLLVTCIITCKVIFRPMNIPQDNTIFISLFACQYQISLGTPAWNGRLFCIATNVGQEGNKNWPKRSHDPECINRRFDRAGEPQCGFKH